MSKTRPVPNVVGIDGPSIVLPGWAAYWLETKTDLRRQRIARRGDDVVIDQLLADLGAVALDWANAEASTGSDSGSDRGTKHRFIPEPATGLSGAMGVATAADLIGIGDRAIAERRLPATQVGGRYLINREDVERFRADRAA